MGSAPARWIAGCVVSKCGYDYSDFADYFPGRSCGAWPTENGRCAHHTPEAIAERVKRLAEKEDEFTFRITAKGEGIEAANKLLIQEHEKLTREARDARGVLMNLEDEIARARKRATQGKEITATSVIIEAYAAASAGDTEKAASLTNIARELRLSKSLTEAPGGRSIAEAWKPEASRGVW